MTSGTSRSPLDEINRRLLTELQGNPRLSMSALARRVGMSAPAVTERVQRLEATGVIRGYQIDIDPAALGFTIAAWVRVRPVAGQVAAIAQLAADLPGVTECHRISGEDTFLLKVHAAALEELEDTLDRFLAHGQTITSVVVSTPIAPRPLPL